MMESSKKSALLAALPVLALGVPAATSHVYPAQGSFQKVESLKAASFQSMESSWLKVPRACKAQNFFAQPQPITDKVASSLVQEIYKAYA
jgi:hypothetical protein